MEENKGIKRRKTEDEDMDCEPGHPMELPIVPVDPNVGLNAENNEDDDNDGIPSLVLELVMQSITDVSLLKKCRRVNKYWNHLACLSLQKRCVTILREDDDKINNFLGILLDRSFGPLTSPDSPFKDFHIVASRFVGDVFYNLVRRPNIAAKSITISFSGQNMRYENLKDLIRQKKDEVTSLTISTFHPNIMRDVLDEVKFTSLKSLVVREFCEYQECGHVELLKSSLHIAPLTSLDIKIDSSTCFFSLLTMDLTRIEKLILELNYLDSACWDALAAVQLPSLKILNIFCFNSNEKAHAEQLNLFFRNASATLVQLEHNVFCDLDTNIVFPQLKRIVMPAVTPAEFKVFFSTQKLPKLTDIGITYSSINSLRLLKNDFERHEGIEKFDISFEGVQDEFQTIFPIWITNLARKFPSITEFGMEAQSFFWTSEFLLYIHRAFPNLKALRINGPVDFEVLSGTLKEETDEYLANGWSLENITRRMCIFDFKDLESLTLEPGDLDYNLSIYTIRNCLALLPKLTYLRFPWNNQLSAQAVADCLQRLKVLEITNTTEFANAMRELNLALPSCSVRVVVEI